MPNLTIPNTRQDSTVLLHTRLKDNGVAVDWSGLSDVRAFFYSDIQKVIAGKCEVAVGGGDSTVLDVLYAATKPQYLGVNSLVIRATYQGREKTFDVPVVNFVERTAQATGVVTLEDPELDVEIEVSEVSTSLLDGAIAAALDAAEEALAAAQDARDAAEEAREAAHGGGDPDAVKFTPQTLSSEQKAQARENIGAGTYTKPAGGIPGSDIADNAVVKTTIQSLGPVLAENARKNIGAETDRSIMSTIYEMPADFQTDDPSVVAEKLGIRDVFVLTRRGFTRFVLDDGQSNHEVREYAMSLRVLGGNDLSLDFQAGKELYSLVISQSPAFTFKKEELVFESEVEQEIPSSLADLSEDATHRVVTDSEKATWNGKYTKPGTGIPASDLASGVIPDVSGKEDTSNKVTSWGGTPSNTKYPSEKLVKDSLDGKQGTIIDLATIRSGAEAGATAYQKPGTGIPASDLAQGVIPDVSGKENTSNKVTSLSAQSSNTQYPGAKATYDEIHPAVGNAQPQGGMLPNVVYDLGTLTGTVTFALATPSDANIPNAYHWTFETGSTAPTINWPSGVIFPDGVTPTAEANKHYEVLVRKGYGSIITYSLS